MQIDAICVRIMRDVNQHTQIQEERFAYRRQHSARKDARYRNAHANAHKDFDFHP